MITLSHFHVALIGGAMLVWLVVASWAVITGLQLRRRAAFATAWRFCSSLRQPSRLW